MNTAALARQRQWKCWFYFNVSLRLKLRQCLFSVNTVNIHKIRRNNIKVVTYSYGAHVLLIVNIAEYLCMDTSTNPNSKHRWPHVGPTWILSAPRWANVGPTRLAIWEGFEWTAVVEATITLAAASVFTAIEFNVSHIYIYWDHTFLGIELKLLKTNNIGQPCTIKHFAVNPFCAIHYHHFLFVCHNYIFLIVSLSNQVPSILLSHRHSRDPF